MRSREMMQQRTILASTAEEWDAKINEEHFSLCFQGCGASPSSKNG